MTYTARYAHNSIVGKLPATRLRVLDRAFLDLDIAKGVADHADSLRAALVGAQGE